MATTPSTATAANVRAEMARAGLSQTALAGHLDLSQTAVSARLRGITPFALDELYVVARVLSIPVAALLPEPAEAAS